MLTALFFLAIDLLVHSLSFQPFHFLLWNFYFLHIFSISWMKFICLGLLISVQSIIIEGGFFPALFLVAVGGLIGFLGRSIVNITSPLLYVLLSTFTLFLAWALKSIMIGHLLFPLGVAIKLLVVNIVVVIIFFEIFIQGRIGSRS